MALGGGLWTSQNKTLPGTYVNFSSIARATATLSERGYAALPLVLDWGPDGKVFTLTSADFQKESLKLLGFAYADAAALPLRELFLNASTLYAYRLNSGGAKAANAFCTAKYPGIAGNKLYTVIAKNVDNASLFDVSTYFGTDLIDAQTVAQASALVENDFVTFKSDATLEETAKTPLTGGTNGTITNASYQAFLDKIESYSFNAMGCPSVDSTVAKLFATFTQRMRDEVGAKFQTVIYNPSSSAKLADYEGVIEVGNEVSGVDTSINGLGVYGLIYWATGAAAGCAANRSNTDKLYDGELTVKVDFTQAELEKAIKEGRFMFHNVNGDVRVLEDVNSLVTTTDTKGDDFKSNQTIRVCDQIANDVAVLFNTRYLGTVPNDASGRTSLWNDVCKVHQDLETLRAIEDFDPESVTVEQGNTKRSVVCNLSGLSIVNAMSQLYMSIVIQ